jgi:hypothetical protein
MSIYATLWQLRFPEHGEYHIGCGWVEVVAQGVPAHIGSGVLDPGYADGDPYASFLPPAITAPPADEERALRAVVFITAGTPKGTDRSPQEYANPLLVLTGEEYAALPFQDLHDRICDLLHGDHPRCVSEKYGPDGCVRLIFEDGSTRDVRGK